MSQSQLRAIRIPPPSPVPAPSPVTAPERIDSLDVLRGVAVMGILIMNIQAFSMIGAAYMNPTAYGDLSGVNYWVWYFSHLLFDQKMMTIFSMLFGAGIVLMTERAEARTGHSEGVHFRRMAWLLLFGLLHAHLLWYGDILYFYAMCGFLVYFCRKWPPYLLFIIGIAAISFASLIMLFFGYSMPMWPESEIASFQADWAPTQIKIEEELAVYRGGWLGQLPDRSLNSFFMETFLLVINLLWRAGGVMLLGMALFKLRAFNAACSTAFYFGLIGIALLIGLPLTGFGIYQHEAHEWGIKYSFFLGGQFNYWGSILVALGWIGLVMLICKTPALRLITRPFAAAGQIALTNYLMQTIICTTIFYGHGFGHFGSFTRVEQLQTVLAIWAFQLILSPIWLHFFRFGPFEWVWRSLTYWRFQPMRRLAA